ncbi:MAG: hypothetical protein JO180_11785 [Gemmatirosa sp.]|nr:hypothetical protein [Gemmatirosa sp.]
MRRLRIVLAGLPPMLRDIVHHTIGREPDMQVVAELADAAVISLGGLDVAGGVDVVVVGAAPVHDAELAASILYQHARSRVLTIEARGGQAALYELRPYRIALGEVSPQAVVDVLRAAAVR